jgi:hypothetical protein
MERSKEQMKEVTIRILHPGNAWILIKSYGGELEDVDHEVFQTRAGAYNSVANILKRYACRKCGTAPVTVTVHRENGQIEVCRYNWSEDVETVDAATDNVLGRKLSKVDHPRYFDDRLLTIDTSNLPDAEVLSYKLMSMLPDDMPLEDKIIRADEWAEMLQDGVPSP